VVTFTHNPIYDHDNGCSRLDLLLDMIVNKLILKTSTNYAFVPFYRHTQNSLEVPTLGMSFHCVYMAASLV